MNCIDERHSMIEIIHENINIAASYIWFNNLTVVELANTCSELKMLAMQLVMDEGLGIDDMIANVENDPVLSCYLDAKVYYFWGEENKAIFNRTGKKHDIEFTDDIDCISFYLEDVLFIFLHYDDLATKDFAHGACKAVQKNWYFSNVSYELSLIDEMDEFFIQKTIPFLISHIYHYYDLIAQMYD